jgi:hypothetical protein
VLNVATFKKVVKVVTFSLYVFCLYVKIECQQRPTKVLTET